MIQLASSATLKSVQLLSLGIRKVEIAKCEGSQANTWETVATQMSDEPNELQRIQLDVTSRVNATYLKIKVTESLFHICFF